MQPTIGKYRWTICALLFLATTVNYLDRQVLSLLKPVLEDQFHWSNSDYANIAAVFQFTYAICLLFAGHFVDRLGTKWGYTIAIIIWSVGAMLHAVAIPIGTGIAAIGTWMGFTGVPIAIAGFMVARAVLGLGESGNFPAAIKATAEYFPKKERSFATGIFNSGTNVGAILAPLTVPWIALHWGWESAFLIIGAAGFAWIILWFLFYERPLKQHRLTKEEFEYIHSGDEENEGAAVAPPISWVRLLTKRPTWAFIIGKFMTDGIWWFFLFWLPAFLKDQYGMNGSDMMIPLTVLYSMTMFGSIGGGWFPVYFINKGFPVPVARMRAMLVIAFIPLVVLLAQPLGHTSFWMPVILIGIGASAHQAWSANIFTTVSDLFPKRAVASVVGIGGMSGGIGGVLITKLAGALFDHYKALGHIETGYSIMFTICALAYLAAWVMMKLLVPVHKPITDW